MRTSSLLYIAGWFGLTGIALGAFGAHALKDTLVASGHLGTWETAVLYQLIHTPALLWVSQREERSLRFAGIAWAIGVLLFSGSLYALALGGPKSLGPVTPIGGIAFILGWAAVMLAGRKERARED